MKSTLSLITLFACAAAGTSLLATSETVSAYRASSGTYTNSADATFVGNSVWGADAKNLGEKFLADIHAERDMQLEWDAGKVGFYRGDELEYNYNTGETFYVKEYWSVDFVAVLDGSASFVNKARLLFSYSGEESEYEEDYNYETGKSTYALDRTNIIMLAGNSKFTNAGTILCESVCTDESPYSEGYGPGFEIFLRDNAVFENSGKFLSEEDADAPWTTLVGNSKFINTETGEMGDTCISLNGNGVFENRGTLGGWIELEVTENATFVNRGTYAPDSKDTEFWFRKGQPAGTAKIENYGTMDLSGEWSSGNDIQFEIEANEKGELPTNVSASFENYGTLKLSSFGDFDLDIDDEYYGGKYVNRFDEFKGACKTLLSKSDLHLKNYGTIDFSEGTGHLNVSTAVKLTLAEGSRINGNVAIGTPIEYYNGITAESHEFRIYNDVLNIVLTGKGNNEPLIAGNLELCNIVKLGVSFAEDAVKKRKYALTIWDGMLLQREYDGTGDYYESGFLPKSLSGTLSKFGMTYDWSLDTTTGVLTAKDVNINKEYLVTSRTREVSLEANDIATLDSSLTEYSGAISGGGEIYSEVADLEFSGDLSKFTGTMYIDRGEVFVGRDADLGRCGIVVGGEMEFGNGKRMVLNGISGNGEISLDSGADVSFVEALGVKTLSVESDATLRGRLSLTHKEAELSLEGTVVLDADSGEKVSLNGGTVKLLNTATLDLVGKGVTTRSVSAGAQRLASGKGITIFEGGKIEGNVVDFLKTDTDIAAYAQGYTVLYDAIDGLSVRVVKEASALTEDLDLSGFSESFVEVALGSIKNLDHLPTGLVSVEKIGNFAGVNDPLLDAIISGDAGTTRSILDRLSPKSYAAMFAMSAEIFHSDVRSISARLEQRRYDGFSENAQWEFFAQAQGNSVENDTATDSATFDFDTYGLLAGADYKVDAETIFGVALGVNNGKAKIHNNGGEIESSDFSLTCFIGSTIEERFFLNTGMQLGYTDYDVERKTDYGNATGDTSAWRGGVFAETGMVLTISQANKLYAMPYAGIAYIHTATDDFEESGAYTAFAADKISGNSLRARVGCEFSWGFDLAETSWRLGLDAAYSYDFLGDEVDIDVMTQGGDKISETAKAMPESVFSVGPTLNVDLTRSMSIYANYTFNAGTDSYVNHSGNLGFRVRF